MTAIVAVIAVLCYAAGLASGLAIFPYAFRIATRYQRVGHIEAPATAEERSPMPSNPEEAAHRRVHEESVQKGADHLMALAEEQGDRITRQEAEAQAREIIRSLHGATSLGGVS